MKTEICWVVERDGSYFNLPYTKWRTRIDIATLFIDKSEADMYAGLYQATVREITLTVK